MKKIFLLAAISFIFTFNIVQAEHTPSGTRTPEIRSTIIGEPKDHINPIPTTKNESSDKIGTENRQRSLDTNRRAFQDSRRKIDEQRLQDSRNKALQQHSIKFNDSTKKFSQDSKDMINR